MKPSRLRCRHVLLGLLVAHIAWGAARMPSKAWGERLEDVDEYRRRGAVAFHLDNRYRSGAAAVDRVLAAAPPDAVVLWRGEWKGALEFVPPLIAPRLLVAEIHCPPGTREYLGRPLAAGRLDDGREGVLLLAGEGDAIRLEVRQ